MARRQTYRQQYQKEISRIKRRIRNIEKRGYEFELPTELQVPEKVTKRKLERLKEKYSIKNIYQYATYETSFGYKLSGEAARKLERRTAAQKGVRTRYEKQWDLYYKEHGEYPESFYKYYNTTKWGWEEAQRRVRESTEQDSEEFWDNVEAYNIPTYEDIIIDNFLDLIEKIDNWTPPSDMGAGVVGIKYRRLQELKDYIISQSRSKEDKMRIGKNIQDNSEHLNEIMDRLMYATYKKDYETSRYGEYGNGYTPEGDFMMIQRIINS